MTVDAVIDRFLHALSQKGASGNTVSAYGQDLVQFSHFLRAPETGRRATRWRQVRREEVEAFLEQLRGRGYADATIARKAAALRAFFRFLRDEGGIQTNPAVGVEPRRSSSSKSPPEPLTPEQLHDLLEGPQERGTPDSLRDRAMLELLYSAGLRVTELLALNVESILHDGRKPVLWCLVGGARERVVPIDTEAADALLAYLENGRTPLLRGRSEHALFVNQRGSRLTRQGFALILGHYAKEAHIEEGLTVLKLRQTFALARQQADDRVRSIYEHAHPRAGGVGEAGMRAFAPYVDDVGDDIF